MSDNANNTDFVELAKKCRWLASQVDQQTAKVLLELAFEYDQRATDDRDAHDDL